MSVNKGLNFHVLVGNAPIHVKPEWGGGGGGVTEGEGGIRQPMGI